MKKELERMILDFVQTWHPNYRLPSRIEETDDMTSVLPLNSLEWMVLIAEIEDHFQIIFPAEALKSHTINGLWNNLKKEGIQ